MFRTTYSIITQVWSNSELKTLLWITSKLYFDSIFHMLLSSCHVRSNQLIFFCLFSSSDSALILVCARVAKLFLMPLVVVCGMRHMRPTRLSMFLSTPEVMKCRSPIVRSSCLLFASFYYSLLILSYYHSFLFELFPFFHQFSRFVLILYYHRDRCSNIGIFRPV